MSLPDPALHEAAELAALTAKTQARRRRILQAVAGLVIVLLSVATTLGVQATIGAQGERDANAVTAQTYANQLEAVGVTPAVDPETIKGDTGAPGEAGPAGPEGPAGPAGADAPPLSEAQVLVALRTLCAEGGVCRPVLTKSQVALALQEYCSADGVCRGPRGVQGEPGEPGPQGEPGEPGQPGEDGSTGEPGAPGEDAPPITQAQLNGALETFCAGGACVGPVGPEGPRGPAGPVCADGFEPQQRTVFTLEEPLGVVSTICVAA